MLWDGGMSPYRFRDDDDEGCEDLFPGEAEQKDHDSVEDVDPKIFPDEVVADADEKIRMMARCILRRNPRLTETDKQRDLGSNDDQRMFVDVFERLKERGWKYQEAKGGLGLRDWVYVSPDRTKKFHSLVSFLRAIAGDYPCGPPVLLRDRPPETQTTIYNKGFGKIALSKTYDGWWSIDIMYRKATWFQVAWEQSREAAIRYYNTLALELGRIDAIYDNGDDLGEILAKINRVPDDFRRINPRTLELLHPDHQLYDVVDEPAPAIKVSVKVNNGYVTAAQNNDDDDDDDEPEFQFDAPVPRRRPPTPSKEVYDDAQSWQLDDEKVDDVMDDDGKTDEEDNDEDEDEDDEEEEEEERTPERPKKVAVESARPKSMAHLAPSAPRQVTDLLPMPLKMTPLAASNSNVTTPATAKPRIPKKKAEPEPPKKDEPKKKEEDSKPTPETTERIPKKKPAEDRSPPASDRSVSPRDSSRPSRIPKKKKEDRPVSPPERDPALSDRGDSSRPGELEEPKRISKKKKEDRSGSPPAAEDRSVSPSPPRQVEEPMRRKRRETNATNFFDDDDDDGREEEKVWRTTPEDEDERLKQTFRRLMAKLDYSSKEFDKGMIEIQGMIKKSTADAVCRCLGRVLLDMAGALVAPGVRVGMIYGLHEAMAEASHKNFPIKSWVDTATKVVNKCYDAIDKGHASAVVKIIEKWVDKYGDLQQEAKGWVRLLKIKANKRHVDAPVLTATTTDTPQDPRQRKRRSRDDDDNNATPSTPPTTTARPSPPKSSSSSSHYGPAHASPSKVPRNNDWHRRSPSPSTKAPRNNDWQRSRGGSSRDRDRDRDRDPPTPRHPRRDRSVSHRDDRSVSSRRDDRSFSRRDEPPRAHRDSRAYDRNHTSSGKDDKIQNLL